jgi:two-component system, oxyanion-binding sensor
MSEHHLRIGFIPLTDAAALLIAVDKGFAAKEGLAIDLVREVSWSNVRDKLNIGLFDAVHLLAPVAVASTLGIGHVKVPLLAPFMLGLNGNAITVSPELYEALSLAADGDLTDPFVSARSLAHVAAERRRRSGDPITFGMTFPFSTHNYQLRVWMAAGAIDPDEDVRLVVLPPPYMVDSLANGHVDGFCVGAPWNGVAVDRSVGRILHFGTDIVARAPEKVLAVRTAWADENGEVLQRLLRALGAAAAFINNPPNLDETVALLAAPNRVGVAGELIRTSLEGRVRIATTGAIRNEPHYLLIGRENAARPDPVHAAWLYAQMVRWGQAPRSAELLAAAQSCFRPDLYAAALGDADGSKFVPADGVGLFTGSEFNAGDICASA